MQLCPGGIFNIHSAAACDGSTRISIEILRPRKLHVTINIASYDGSGVEYVRRLSHCRTTTEAISTSIDNTVRPYCIIYATSIIYFNVSWYLPDYEYIIVKVHVDFSLLLLIVLD